MKANANHERAMDNARASITMEGYEITPLMNDLCKQVLEGKITLSESVSILRKSQKQEK